MALFIKEAILLVFVVGWGLAQRFLTCAQEGQAAAVQGLRFSDISRYENSNSNSIQPAAWNNPT